MKKIKFYINTLSCSFSFTSSSSSFNYYYFYLPTCPEEPVLLQAFAVLAREGRKGGHYVAGWSDWSTSATTTTNPILTLAADSGPIHPSGPHQFRKAYGPILGTAAAAVLAPFECAPAEACLSVLWAATAPEVEADWARWQGAYVSAPGVRGTESVMAGDEDRGELLWAMSEGLVRQLLGNEALHPWTTV